MTASNEITRRTLRTTLRRANLPTTGIGGRGLDWSYTLSSDASQATVNRAMTALAPSCSTSNGCGAVTIKAGRHTTTDVNNTAHPMHY